MKYSEEKEYSLFEKIAKGTHLLAKLERKRANKPQTLQRKREVELKNELKNVTLTSYAEY